jgi:Vitamin K-dependent gamma-carboxylase
MSARVSSAIRRLFQLDVDPFVLGLFRVGLGAYVLLFYVMLAPSWIYYYGVGGIASCDRLDLGSYQLLSSMVWYVRSDAAMWTLYGLSVASAILLALGIRWRLALAWLWYMNLSLMYGNVYVVNGEEQVMALLLLFSLFLPLGASFTWRQLSSRKRRRAMLRADMKVRVWALKPLQVHLVLVYLLSLPDKLADSAWTHGTLVYYAMMAVDYPRWPGLDVFAWGNAALSRVLTAFSLAVELLVPMLVWFRRLRVPCVLAAMALHLGMAFLLEGVMMFNLAMFVGLLLFLPSRRTRQWLARRLGVQA